LEKEITCTGRNWPKAYGLKAVVAWPNQPNLTTKAAHYRGQPDPAATTSTVTGRRRRRGCGGAQSTTWERGEDGEGAEQCGRGGDSPGKRLDVEGGEGGGALAVACGSAPHLHHREKEKSMRRRPRRRLSGWRLALTREGGGGVALA
jgi:hypothetical protein